ncbi:MAG TPA: hypothetical protein VFO60_06855 [Candidatus Dormibacteraeota bacterium]|nr:hypothetical protein [Candidatus Dormibacteraeota bacterium]
MLAKDQDLSSFVGTIAGGPPTYVQDDCAYSSSSGGATIRVVLVEPSAGGGTRAQGQSAYTFVQEDLEANGGATLTRVDGLGDAAAMWLQAGDSFAERIVLDHEIVFSIGVENAADPEAVVRAVATAALTRADSGRADGRPGS